MVGFILNKIQTVLIIIGSVVLIALLYTQRDAISIKDFFIPNVSAVKIGEVLLEVEIASTTESRVSGLSGREDLGKYDGMLFIFPNAGYPEIWMKDMLFPIDLVWIDENLKVISIQKNVLPSTYPEKFRPPRPAKYLIETGIHFSDTFNIREGLKVELYID
ncbi:MAG TPA: DUF192 domain-containing protein [Candidatus Paceibacterota bacterium]|nr:DUF192 domain-containing protein [Candidatus Paceibacterota bacterium]